MKGDVINGRQTHIPFLGFGRRIAASDGYVVVADNMQVHLYDFTNEKSFVTSKDLTSYRSFTLSQRTLLVLTDAF